MNAIAYPLEWIATGAIALAYCRRRDPKIADALRDLPELARAQGPRAYWTAWAGLLAEALEPKP